jgi:hypothetical protein
MNSLAWTEVAEPYITALPDSLDPAVKTCVNELHFAVHTNDEIDLCDAETFAGVSATIDDLKRLFLDDEGASNLEGLLHASRFCQAHRRFGKKSVFSVKQVEEKKLFSEQVAHTIAARTDYVWQQTRKIAADSITFRPNLRVPYNKNPSGYLYYLRHTIKDTSLEDIPQKDSKGRVFAEEKATFVESIRNSIESLCTDTETFYRKKDQKELEEMVSAEAEVRARWAQAK